MRPSKVGHILYETLQQEVASATWRSRVILGVNSIETPIWLVLEDSLHNEVSDNFWRYIDELGARIEP